MLMFIKSFQMFESVSLNDILSKKDEILRKWDLEIKLRQGSQRIVDIYIMVDGEPSPRAIYDLQDREFILFYKDRNSKPLPASKWIRIKSDDFFDLLDRVVGYLYYDL